MALHYFLNSASSAGLTGWAFDDRGDPVSIEIVCPTGNVVSAKPNLPRPDVAAAFPGVKTATLCGFDIPLELDGPGAFASLNVRIKAGPQRIDLGAGYKSGRNVRLTFLQDAGVLDFLSDDPSSIRTPLPKPIGRGMLRLWPELRTVNWDSEAEHEAIAGRLGDILASEHLARLPDVVAYLRYISQVWCHFQFVEKRFPALNLNVTHSAKDRICKANSAGEMLSIANQLFVLRSYGIPGDFVEFGCFKGYSTSMLSYACHLLGVRMHVFDSFQGLPASDSAYYKKGDYKGSLAEVKQHVDLYGSPQAVSYHPGFFSESLEGFNENLMSIWMDVDLDSSARDVMKILPQLDAKGTLFSHECTQANFSNGRVESGRTGPEHVVPAIVDGFRSLKRPITGRMVSGYTGAFWNKIAGSSPFSHRALMKLVDYAVNV